MLEVEITTECTPQHLFVIHIDSVLEAPQKGKSIICNVCQRPTKIRRVGTPGRIREEKPSSPEQTNLEE